MHRSSIGCRLASRFASSRAAAGTTGFPSRSFAGYSSSGLRFAVADIGAAQATSVPVVYRGSVPDLFKAGRDVVVDGTYRNGVFVAKRNTLVTKCPSKYSPKKS